jgi:hypothetical protein
MPKRKRSPQVSSWKSKLHKHAEYNVFYNGRYYHKSHQTQIDQLLNSNNIPRENICLSDEEEQFSNDDIGDFECVSDDEELIQHVDIDWKDFEQVFGK